MESRGMIALSADPITNGHLDIISRAAISYKEIIVVILNNDLKQNYTFSLLERENMAKRAIKHANISNVQVISSNKLLTDVYLEYGCDCLIRGIRNNQDKEYEETQMQYHKAILPSLEVVYFDASEKLKIVSSSVMKAWASHGIETTSYVPLFVKELLEQKICKQYKIAITGQMATGKSWVTKKLKDNINYLIKIISIDDLVHSVYSESSNGAEDLRNQINDIVRSNEGPNVLNTEGVDRKFLGEFMFSSKCNNEIRQTIQKYTFPHIQRKYREVLYGFQGLIIFEWAQLAEMNMASWTNNNVIVVDTPDRETFIAARGLDPKIIAERAPFQWSTEKKIQSLTKQIELDDNGRIFHHIHNIENSNIKELSETIKKFFNI